jgi:protein ImuB
MMGASGTRRRLLALWFPRLPTDRLKRHDASSGSTGPRVVAAKERNALRLSAVDDAAARLGLHVGQPLANARAMVPTLAVAAANPAADAALLSRLAEWCDRFTPLVALDAPDGLLLDIAGASHLFGGEAAMLATILGVLRVNGFSVQGAIAGTAVAARALARHRDRCIAGEGGDAAAVSPLPVEALQLDAVTAHALRRAGLKTIGQAAGRKRAEIVSRFGAATMAVIDEALGRAATPVSPRRPSPDYWRARNFAEPVATLDVILGALRALAGELSALMEREGVGARHVEASFFRSDGAVRRIAVETGSPVRDAAVIGRLFQERLSALADPLDPGFGFDMIRLAALRVEASPAAAGHRADAGRSEAQEIGFLVDRLAARFGRQRILRFAPRQTHVPEAAWVMTPAQDRPDIQAGWHAIRAAPEAPRRPLRLFAPPQPVTVEQPPLRLSWRRVPRLLTRWEGPERIAMEWWRPGTAGPARDYYRAEDAEGRCYWIYCEPSGEPPRWFLHGLFA